MGRRRGFGDRASGPAASLWIARGRTGAAGGASAGRAPAGGSATGLASTGRSSAGGTPAGRAPAAAANRRHPSRPHSTCFCSRHGPGSDRYNPTRAIEAAQRALRLAPNNAQALAVIAQAQASSGQLTAAQQTLAMLEHADPGAPEIGEVQQAIRLGAINPDALANARQLAQQGNAAQAAELYQSLFGGGPPPDSLAVEYYQTLGATPSGYAASVQGLADAARRNPDDLRAQLAYAQALTYRQDTRMQGIDRLQALTAIPAISVQAQNSWRQALGWLPSDQSSVAAIKAYQARFPNDNSAAALLADALNPPHQAPGSQFAREGYDAFHRGDLTQAQQLFQQALNANPNDAAATAGLGLVMLRQGKSADATRLIDRAIALDPKQAPGLRQALAGAQTSGAFAAAQAASNRGDLPEAETLYRRLLAQQPGNDGIKLALAGVLAREGDQQEANALLAQVENGGGQASQQARAQLLAQQAEAMPDTAGKIALYRSAVDAAPTDPWLRLNLARALVANGQPGEAQTVMSAVTDVARPSSAALQAGIIFANETNNSAEAMTLIQQVPRRQRTPEMQAMLDQAAVQSQIAAAVALAPSDPMSARQQLLALATQPDPTGARGLAIARAFIGLSDPADATTAISAAAAVNPTAGAAARLNWAQGLLAAGNTAAAAAMLADVTPSQLTPDQQQSLNSLRNGIAVRSSDTLNTAGRTADAYDQLAPALARSPDDPALNSALGRLYQTADQPQQALAINQRILAIDPNNADARRGAVAAAIQLGDYSLASRLVTDQMAQNPNDPQNWILAADIAQARGLNADALHDLRQARALREQQLGFAGGTDAPNGGVMLAANGNAATALGAVSSNPFRNAPDSSDPGASGTVSSGVLAGSGLVNGSQLASAAPLNAAPAASANDPMIADIDTRITAINTQIAPYVGASTALDFRSGSAGTSQLTNFGVPIEASFSPAGVGRVTMAATPTYLTAGAVGTQIYNAEQFGSALFDQYNGAAAPGNQTASGVGLDLGYKAGWFSGDIGSTPLGFKIANVVGGVEIAPQITNQLILRVTGERRAVTDSLLSYAGTFDPGTGTTWGGVTRTRIHAQLEFNPGQANFYAGGGYDWLQGQNVLDNTELELGAGGSYPIYQTPSDQVRVGLNLVYFDYSKNEDFFTLGYGGYFSPQTYVAALIPVTWQATRGNLTYTLGASVGVQTYNEDGAPLFPSNPGLQAAADALAATNTQVQSSYASQNSTGIAGSINGRFEYHLTPMLTVGGSGGFQRAGNWNEADMMAFARYTFAGSE